MHPADIVAAVKKRGSSLSEISRTSGLATSAVSVALLMPSRRAEEALIKFLGLPPNKVFPDRYDANGTRFRRSRRSADEIKRGVAPRFPQTAAQRRRAKDLAK